MYKVEGIYESVAIDVDKDKLNLMVAEIYRIPNNNERLLIERYEIAMTLLSGTKHNIILRSDQNFD